MAVNRLPARSQEGFSLLELLVALALSASILVYVVFLLDLAGRVGRVEIDIAAAQQSQRTVHDFLADAVRLAGRGGLPSNLALNVADNVPADYEVAGNPTVDGTDVLRIRGLFETLLVVNTKLDSSFGFDSATREGFVVVESMMPTGIARQDLEAIEHAIDQNLPIALMLVSARSNQTFAVVEMQGTSTIQNVDLDDNGTVEAWERRAILRFSADPTRGTYNSVYTALSSDPSGWPEALTRAGTVGIFQEYQFYLRDPQSASEGNRPVLSRAALYPGTDVVAGDARNGRLALADGLVDLQISRAFDADLDFRLDEDQDNPQTDEWLGNHPDDQIPSIVGFAEEQQLEALGWPVALMSHVQIATLVATQRPDLGFVSPALDRFENRTYDEEDDPADAELIERRHRRRQHRTVVAFRNI